VVYCFFLNSFVNAIEF